MTQVFFRKDLTHLRATAIAEINARAGVARGRYITVAPGQEMIYLRKETEARRYLELETPPETLVDFPFMAAEIGVTASTPYELAQLWLNMSAMFEVVGSQLEQVRLQSIYAVEEADHPAVIDGILHAFKTQLQ